MAVKINEFVIQFKVHEASQPVENTTNKPVGYLPDRTEQQDLVREVVDALLEDREAR
ncbi:Afp-like protein [Cardinium endosymbiont of Sogatella furcifera]|uniref:DUF5908 family protein n=1 Tax=Cardinium endosymbiont of Sogatella furcifera TaxID=650378 RepID=UPI000E10B066|nr:DUF5908 family protein [Cardinium endosymbiont of Sogatella furcifera]AXI24304.1 Afp-like protein [Cardinium endosymbiont of Sogatella furcifera]